MISDRIFNLLVLQSWQVASVGLIVWIIVRATASERPHLAHALWVLVLLKCVTPPIWSSPTSPFSWWRGGEVETVEFRSNHPAAAAFSHVIPTFPAATTQAASLIPELSSAPASTTPQRRLPSARTLLAGIWMLGVLASLIMAITRSIVLFRLLHRSRIETPEGLETQVKSLARSLGMSGRVRVCVLDAQIGPAVTGYGRPAILLPQSIVASKNASGLTPLLAHEMIHIRRGDLYTALLQTVSKACLWFHPVVWLASRQVDRESERCCDEETVASLGCEPSRYARMLLDVLEAKHRLRVIPALPGVRPVNVTAKRLERIMRFGNGDRNGIHTRRPWWATAAFMLGAIVILPGAARVIGQDRSLPTADVSDDAGLEFQASENSLFSKDLNYGRQITIEIKLMRIPTRLLDGLKLPWEDEKEQSAHCVLDEVATQELLSLLTRDKRVVQQSAPKITLFDGDDWRIEQTDQRTFVTSWEPFPGQENQPVKTLSPVTNVFEVGFHVQGQVKCVGAGSDIKISTRIERTSIASVETSMFDYAQDIGGEPHPIQTPKMNIREQSAQVGLPIHASLVMRQRADNGKMLLTVIAYQAFHETPEVAVAAAKFLSTQSTRSSGTVVPAAALATVTKKAKQVPVSKVYVDTGIDFTPEQLELIAIEHDQLGFESVQIREGRLRVLAQDLAHVTTARNRVESRRPENQPLIRGGTSGEDFDYTLLTTALASSEIPCQIEGRVDYTINREHIELRAAPMEISFADSEQSFHLRSDSGEVRVMCKAGRADDIRFKGSNVTMELGDWKVTANTVETDYAGFTLRGHILIERGDGQQGVKLETDELRIDPEKWGSIEEMVKHFTDTATSTQP